MALLTRLGRQGGGSRGYSGGRDGSLKGIFYGALTIEGYR
jgi:hypothetical protein